MRSLPPHGKSPSGGPSRPPESGWDPASEFWRPAPGVKKDDHLGGGRILIVDDEPDVCVYVALALKRLGFESSASTDPFQALDLISTHPDRFRLLLTDQRMPGMSGLDLIKKVWTAVDPDFPVVLMSGYAWGIDAAALPGVGFLSKPFETADLRSALRTALNQER